MNRNDIAFEYLSKIQQAQLIHFYPELAKKEKDKYFERVRKSRGVKDES